MLTNGSSYTKTGQDRYPILSRRLLYTRGGGGEVGNLIQEVARFEVQFGGIR